MKRLLRTHQLKAFTSSLYNSHTILYLLSKTLNFFSPSSMEPFLFDPLPPWDEDLYAFDSSSPSPSQEPLFLVLSRWWFEANAAIFIGEREIRGVLYDATSSLRNNKNKKFKKNDDDDDNELILEYEEVESEIVLEMRTAGQTGTVEEEGVSGCDSSRSELCLSLISEWMFLRAFKWHNDRKDAGGFLDKDLFSLQIRLSCMIKEHSLYIRINQKDNEIRAFQRACDIFCIESGLLKISDFSGQTTQFLTNEKKLLNVSDQPGYEILLKLEVYGLLYSRVKQSSPLDGGYSNAFTMGLTGLSNLGNTCFMNSALQCLVHTTELVDYFLGDFRNDLNFENPLGMNGNLARAFGELLRKLWTPGATAVTPREFKSKIAVFAPRFSGYNQHDSQEFLSFLLDGLHEDLNRVKSKPYIEVKDGYGRSDEEVADEQWRNHLARNDSIIVDLFQGQYRSRVVCPVCKEMSITYDPFMYLSLPLPSPTETTRTMTLTVWSTDGTTLPSSVTIIVPKFGNLKDLVQALSVACSLGDNEILLVAEVYDCKIRRFLEDPSDTFELIRDNDQLVAYRLPKDGENSSLVVFTHQYKEKGRIGLKLNSNTKSSFSEMDPTTSLTKINIYPTKIDCLVKEKRLGLPGLPSRQIKFGLPLLSRMSSFSEGTEMRKEFLKLLHPFLRPRENSSDDNDDTCNIDNKGLEIEDTILDQEENLHSEFKSDSTNTLKDCDIHMDEPVSIPNSNAVDVLVSWPDKMWYDYDTCLLDSLSEVCKPTPPRLMKAQESVSLYNCLDAFLKEEPLGLDDMWYCPGCKSHGEASKKLDLWRLPEILVIHLKRFSYNRFLINKLENFVDFPTDDFELSNYMIHKDSSISRHYMLYAVINHYGRTGSSGHYTAFVKHRGSWYNFDDTLVYTIREKQLKTSSAYVLFYRRISDTV